MRVCEEVSRSLLDEWRLGWFCSPLSRFLFNVEYIADFDFKTEHVWSQSSGSDAPNSFVHFLQRALWAVEEHALTPRRAALLVADGRAVCYQSGVCDCLVPLRGPLCMKMDTNAVDSKRPYRGRTEKKLHSVLRTACGSF